MKINIIHHDFSSNVLIDVEVLSFILKKFKEKPQPVYVNVNNYKCEEAIINIFIESINYSYFSKAKYNIFIPNQQYFHKNQIEFLDCFDMIFAKSNYIYETFKNHVSENKLNYIGWRSPDISISAAHKSYNDYLVFYQDTNFYPLKTILELWEESFPNLNVVMQVNRKDLTLKEQDNITYYDNKDMDVEKFHTLFNKCGVHLCLSEIDSYSHLINQCKLVKSIPIAVGGGPMRELMNRDWGYSIGGKKKKLKEGIGSRYVFNKEDFVDTVNKIKDLSEKSLESMGNNGRQDALKRHGLCDNLFKEHLSNVFKITRPMKFDRKEISDDKLPTVSIITPTYNRYKFFPLAILNFNCANYPRNKLEWIIVDDSDDDGEKITKLLPPEDKWDGMRLKYIKLDEKKTIGEKRNIGIENATHDVIACMDDDDYYPPDSIRERVVALIKQNKKCICCTTIGCFHISRFISIISAPPIHDSYEQKVSEATLCFYKTFWEEGKFNHENSFESKDMVIGRIKDIGELPFTNVINSLIHGDNTSTRSIPPKQESNGCHFGWNDKLFKFIVNLGK